MRKKLIIGIMLILALGFTGCGNSIVKKSIEQAKASIESKEYDKALLSLEMALDEDNNNEEANKLYSIVDKYQKSKKLLEENNVNEAKKLLDEINVEYLNYTIKDDVDSLKQQIENKIKEIELINSNLTKLVELIDEKKYEEANDLFVEINKSSLSEEQKTKANELKTRIDNELEEIEAKKKTEEEAQYDKVEERQYNACKFCGQIGSRYPIEWYDGQGLLESGYYHGVCYSNLIEKYSNNNNNNNNNSNSNDPDLGTVYCPSCGYETGESGQQYLTNHGGDTSCPQCGNTMRQH